MPEQNASPPALTWTWITVKAGEPRYIRFDLRIGFWGGHLTPTPVSAELGKKEVAECKFDKVAP
jgi:hypothetical protein